MKRILLTVFGVILLIFTAMQIVMMLRFDANATHLFRNNASNINTGTLPNERLNPSSVTLQGNTVSISTIASGLQAINSATATYALGTNVSAATSSLRDEVNALHVDTATIFSAIGALSSSNSVGGYGRILSVGDSAFELQKATMLINGGTYYFPFNPTLNDARVLISSASGSLYWGRIVSAAIASRTIAASNIESNSITGNEILNNTLGPDDIDETANYSFTAITINSLSAVGSHTMSSVTIANLTTTGTVTLGRINVVQGSVTINTVNYVWPSEDGSADQRLTTDGSGVLTWETVTSGSGGGGVSTFTHIQTSKGDLPKASSTTFSAIGMTWTTGRSTWTGIGLRFTAVEFSTGATWLRIAESTGSGGAYQSATSTWSYVTPLIEVSSGMSYSLFTSTSHSYAPQKFYSVHVIDSLFGAQKLTNLQIELEHWRAPY